jgi:hypothetical protein
MSAREAVVALAIWPNVILILLIILGFVGNPLEYLVDNFNHEPSSPRPRKTWKILRRKGKHNIEQSGA